MIINSLKKLGWCRVAGTTEEYKAKLRALGEAVKADPKAYIEEFTVDTAAKTVTRVVYVNGEKKKDSGVMATGVEHDHQAGDGRPAKVIVQDVVFFMFIAWVYV